MGKTVANDLAFIGGAKITGLPAAAGNGQPIIYEQFNAGLEGIAWKDSARVATQANLNLASPGATIDGITMASGDRVLVKAQTSQPENGVYIWNGAAVTATRAPDASTSPELEQATITIEEGTNAGTTWRQTQVNFTLDSGNVVWTAFGTSAPSASETTSGTAEIATQAETDTGTDDARMVTPLKMTNWTGRVRKNVTNIGDNSATQIDVTHNFNTRDAQVEVYRNSTPWDSILCDVERPDANTVRLRFATAPTASQFRVIVWV